MMKKTRVTALLLTFILLAAVLPGGAAAAQGTGDVGAYESDFLRSLGIVDFRADELGKTVSNRDFAGAAALIGGIARDYYTDGLLDMLVKMGHMPGSAAYPDRAVLFEQAVKTFVSVLGYDYLAEENGGYPTGYIYMGNKLKLFKSLNSEVGKELTYGQLAVMMYNALECDIISAYSAKYNVMEGIFDIYEATGKITANSITSINGKNEINAGKILVDGVSFETDTDRFDSLLGLNVTYWYKKDANGHFPKLLYAEEYAAKSKSLTINLDDIVNLTVSNREFRYESGDKVRSVSYEGGYCLVYNGRVADSGIESFYDELMGVGAFAEVGKAKGDITFIDGDDNGVYDLIKLNSYKSFYISKISTFSYTILDRFRNGEVCVLDPSEPDSLYTIFDKAGGQMDIGSLKMYDSVSVLMSQDKKTAKVYYSEERITGKAESIQTVEDKRYITIDGKEYRMAHILNQSTDNLQLGIEYQFAFDKFGEIVGYEYKENIFNVGLVMKISEDSGVFSPNIRIAIYGTDKKKHAYPFAGSVKIDGVKRKSAEEIRNGLYNADGTLKSKLIRYRLNDKEQISAVDTAYYDKDNEPENTLQCVRTVQNVSQTMVREAMMFADSSGRGFVFNAATSTVFSYNSDHEDDEDEYVSIDYKSVADWVTYTQVSAYSVNAKSADVDYIVIPLDDKESMTRTEDNGAMIFEKIGETVLEDGTSAYKLIGMDIPKSGTVEVKVDDIDVIKSLNLSRGDIFSYSRTLGGRLCRINIAYRVKSGKTADGIEFKQGYQYDGPVDMDKASAKSATAVKWTCGRVYAMSATYMYIYSEQGNMSNVGYNDCYVISNVKYPAKYYKYHGDSDRGNVADKVGISDAADYMKYGERASKVLIFGKYNSGNSVIIFE